MFCLCHLWSMNCLSLWSSQRFIVGFAWLIPEYELPLPTEFTKVYCGVLVAHSWVWTASPSGAHKGLLWGSRGSFLSMNCLSLRSSQRFIVGFVWLIPEYELPFPPEFTKVYCEVRVAHSWVWTASPSGVHKGLLWGSRGSFPSMNCLSLRSSQRFIVGFAWLIPEYELPLPPEFTKVYCGVRVAHSWIICVQCFVHPCLLSFDHYIILRCFMYVFWLLHWYLQTLLVNFR